MSVKFGICIDTPLHNKGNMHLLFKCFYHRCVSHAVKIILLAGRYRTITTTLWSMCKPVKLWLNDQENIWNLISEHLYVGLVIFFISEHFLHKFIFRAEWILTSTIKTRTQFKMNLSRPVLYDFWNESSAKRIHRHVMRAISFQLYSFFLSMVIGMSYKSCHFCEIISHILNNIPKLFFPASTMFFI